MSGKRVVDDGNRRVDEAADERAEFACGIPACFNAGSSDPDAPDARAVGWRELSNHVLDCRERQACPVVIGKAGRAWTVRLCHDSRILESRTTRRLA
jgi:hypothetical protein